VKNVEAERTTSTSVASTWEWIGNVASSAWCNDRLFAWILLIAALIVGLHLRFFRLTRWDLSGDEGASWAAASAPSLHEVVETEQRLDPGKLALYDIILHEWIGFFGDSVFAMRILSVGIGIVSLVLVFIAVREACGALGRSSPAFCDAAGAFAAFLYATNLTMVNSDRTVRMYPLLVAAELLQITFLCRAQRRGSRANYAGVAIFTAVMIAANFTASFLIIAEGLWLQCLLYVKELGWRAGGLQAFGPTMAVSAGVALLAPLLPGALALSAGAVQAGYYNWIELQPISWTYTTVRDGVGGHTLLWTFIILGAFGIWYQWRPGAFSSAFFAIWATGSVLAAVALSYLIHPVENQRYIVIAFVGVFAFAAVGAASIRSTLLRLVLLLIVVHFTVHPVHNWLRHPHEPAWRDAARLALQQSAGVGISVVPSYAVDVVHYYLPPEARNLATPVESGCGSGRVLILTGWGWLPPDQLTKMSACYPHLIKILNQIEVRSR